MAKEDIKGQTEAPEPGPQEAKKWLGVLAATEAWRRQISLKAGWETFLKEFEGDWSHVQAIVDIPILPVNLVYAYVKTEIARLYFRDPWITVNPKRPQDILSARIAENSLNYFWGELDLKRQFKLALLDALSIGHGWIKIGYTADFGTIETPQGPGQGISEFIKSENLFAYRVSWRDVLFSPDSLRPPYDSRWIAHRIRRPFSAIKNSKIYKNTTDLRPTRPLDESLLSADIQNIILWEIWDIEHERVLTIAESGEKPLREIPWPYKIEGYPFVMQAFNLVPDKPYPLSDVALWEPQIVELMKLMSIMVNHLKRWNRQVFMKKGMLEEQEMSKFRQGVDGGIVSYMGNASDIFIPPYAPVQQDIYGIWNLVMEIWRNVSGQSEVERGAPARTQTRTLGELRLTLQGGRARADEKVDSLEDSIEEVARKLLQLMKQVITIPKLVRIVGDRPVLLEELQNRPSATGENSITDENVFTMTKEDIQGEFDLQVVAGSTVPLNKENKLEIMQKLLEVSPALGIPPGSQAARELGREILRDIGITSVEKIMQLADEEIETQLAQAQAAQERQATLQEDVARNKATQSEASAIGSLLGRGDGANLQI